MPRDSESKKALLAFMIGQVQPFIEAARTVRDLWTGSYLMSWLTAAAMKPIIDESSCGYGAFVTPHLDQNNPMLLALLNGPTGDPAATLPCLPNKFAAEVPANRAAELRDACLKACQDEWRTICDAVHRRIAHEFGRHGVNGTPTWDRYWDVQVGSFLEMRCVVRPLADNSTEWVGEFDQLGALMEMTRSVRHVPDYRPRADDGRYPGKCSLLGTIEQMGPADFAASREFWRAIAEDWSGLHGTRLRSSDRLCAVSLVKRFAWPAYFAKTNAGRGRLGVRFDELRYSDTATLAAAQWLPNPAELPSDEDGEEEGALDWRRLRRWSGQWLHWTKQNQDKDERPCPQGVWDKIQTRKRACGAPPIYYAILLLDGDRMGDMFRGDLQPAEGDWGSGRRRYGEITRRLTEFSLSVRRIVEDHDGELIYAGGDDVLAVCPTATVLACAKEVREKFRAPECLTSAGSISGGVAVVHYKEDLRFALQQAREAERAAKCTSRRDRSIQPVIKDALALCVCRRSGEHSTAVFGWDQTPALIALVSDFENSSDRWTYQLRAELQTLAGLPPEAHRRELLRLLGRVETPTPGFVERVAALYAAYRGEMTRPERGWPKAEILAGFVTLCQAASFLARGRE